MRTVLDAPSVRNRLHLLAVSLSHDGPAYIGEEYPIVVSVINNDTRALDVHLDVLLQPSEADDAGEYSTSLSAS
jgi:hypothetical protein